MPERNANRVTFGFQLRAADAQIVPSVRLHPDLIPHALAIHRREVDVVIGERRPGLVYLVVADLTPDRADLAKLLLGLFDEVRHVYEEFAVEVSTAGAVPPEEIMARLGRRLGGRASGDVGDRNVVNRNLYAIFLTPVLHESVEPFVVLRNEMAPLHNGQRFGL